MDLSCILDLPSKRAPKYQHLEWSYDLLPSKITNLGSVMIFGGVKTYFSIFLHHLFFVCYSLVSVPHIRPWVVQNISRLSISMD